MTKTKRKTALIIVLCSLLAAVLIISSALFTFLNWNNFILKGFEADFEKAVQAEGFEILETKSVCGKLNGNGNGINYFSAVLIKADEDEVKALVEALETEFEGAKYYLQEDGKIATIHNEHGRLEYETALENGKTYYTVYVFDSKIAGSNPLDPKGH
ncbi:MAG: hypothetical protein J6W15_06300 [Clostridia bacterium]|nr:hypothetical protein [Clostridia bacterium]